MAGGDIAVWRKQNSDNCLLEIVFADGTVVKGALLLPRDKTLRDYLAQPEPFVEIETAESGAVMISKTQLRTLQQVELAKADQLQGRLKALEKMDAFQVLRLTRTATADEVTAAATAMRAVYDPSLCEAAPPEVADYLASMRRRIDTAEKEILDLAKAAARRKPAA